MQRGIDKRPMGKFKCSLVLKNTQIIQIREERRNRRMKYTYTHTHKMEKIENKFKNDRPISNHIHT